jgi:hypothetical protein
MSADPIACGKVGASGPKTNREKAVDINRNGRGRPQWVIRVIAVLPVLALATVVVAAVIRPSTAQATGSPSRVLVRHEQTKALPPTPLSEEITADVVPLAQTILSDYRAAKPQFRQKRLLGGDSVFGTVKRTELAVEDYARSTLTGREAEYVLQAEYAPNAAHTLDPSDVVGIRLSAPTHVVAVPLWRHIYHSTYDVNFTEATHGALVENSYPRYWSIFAEYFVGRANQLNSPAGYDSGGGDSNYDGAGGGICLDPLPPSVVPLVVAQAQQFLEAAEKHTPIVAMPNLSSDFAPCQVP